MRAWLDAAPDEIQAWLQAHGQPSMRARKCAADHGGARRVVRPDDRSAARSAPGPGRRGRAARHAQSPSTARPPTAPTSCSCGCPTASSSMRPHPGPAPAHRLHQHPGRLRHGCVFCASGLNGMARNLTAARSSNNCYACRNLLPADDG